MKKKIKGAGGACGLRRATATSLGRTAKCCLEARASVAGIGVDLGGYMIYVRLVLAMVDDKRTTCMRERV